MKSVVIISQGEYSDYFVKSAYLLSEDLAGVIRAWEKDRRQQREALRQRWWDEPYGPKKEELSGQLRAFDRDTPRLVNELIKTIEGQAETEQLDVLLLHEEEL